MFAPANLDEALSRVLRSAFWDKDLLRQDTDRLRHRFYGPVARPLKARGRALLVGIRSGLEAVLLSLDNPNNEILVVDESPKARHHIQTLLGDGVKAYSSLAEALSSPSSENLDFVRVEASGSAAHEFCSLLDNRQIGYICGEVNSLYIDPIRLFRLARKSAGAFFIHMQGAGYAIGGDHRHQAPEVSVVVPAYNVAEYLDQCLASLAHQTLQSLEVIVVDDGSPDRSGDIADEWGSRFPGRIKTLRKPNGGCASARMAGLHAAQGEYIGFVDGDDWVEPRMYEDLYRAAALRGADIGQCGFYEAYEDGSRVYRPTAWGADGPHGLSGLVHNKAELLTLMPSIWRRIYRRDFLLQNDIQFPVHIKRHDDLPFAFSSIAAANRVSIIPDCYYAYRLGRPGQDVSATDERLYVHFDIFDWLFKKMRPISDYNTMLKLCEVEIGTHKWVIGRLQRQYKEIYMLRAIRDVQSRYGEDNSNPRWREELIASAA